MRRRFKIAFVILMVVTIIWILACYLHVQAYNQMIEGYKQRFGEEFVEKFMDFKSVLAWRNGSLLFMIGLLMVFVWITFLSELYRLKKGR